MVANGLPEQVVTGQPLSWSVTRNRVFHAAVMQHCLSECLEQVIVYGAEGVLLQTGPGPPWHDDVIMLAQLPCLTASPAVPSQ